MPYGLIAGIPLFLFIIGVLYTRRIAEPAMFCSVISVVMLKGKDAVSGYVNIMYEILSDPSFQLLVIVALGFGGLSAILEKSGAMMGFYNIMQRLCKNPKQTLFFTWLLGGIIFVDDYLNALAVSASMKEIVDRQKIPREHLAYNVNCMGACVCVMIPMSSWAAFAIGQTMEYSLSVDAYYRAIPFMFYPICAIIINLLLSLGLFPRIGELKKAYKQMKTYSSVSPDKNKNETNSTNTQRTPWIFLISMMVLVSGTLVLDNNFIAGIFLAFLSLLVLLSFQKRMKLTEILDTFLEGAAKLTPMLITIFFTYIMQNAITQMGFIDYLTEIMSRTIPAYLLPVTVFLSVGCITFFAASFWALIVISFPIFLPMALHQGVNPSLVIAAIMSGVALGSQACLYSDAIFMVAVGTDVPNETQFRTVLPYVCIGAGIAAFLFLVSGILL